MKLKENNLQRYTKRINAIVEPELADQLKEFCNVNRTHMSDFIRESIQNQLSRVNEGQLNTNSVQN